MAPRKTSRFIAVMCVAAAAALLIAAVTIWRSGDEQEAAAQTFQCPMHPEETSTTPGECSQCGMDLVVVEHEHNHGETESTYVCPMHPAEVSDRPGECSICGMDLVPTEPKPEHGEPQNTYHCPMHPTYVSDRPGECPICGMDLVPVQAEPGGSTDHEGVPDGLAAIQISPERQQLIGVRTATIERKTLEQTIRTVGMVVPDETTLSHVHTRVTGWVQTLYVNFEGQRVTSGQPLLEIYSPEVVSTQEEYLLALGAQSRDSSSAVAGTRGPLNLADASLRRLELWNIPAEEIQKLRAAGEPKTAQVLQSPRDGYVLHRNVAEGHYVSPADELLTIADLTRVWVIADIYESGIPLVDVGQKARVTLPYDPGTVYEGRVSYVYPFLDAATRTVKIRFEFDNPELKLKPNMYVNVELTIDAGVRTVIHEDAVLDSGTRQIAFLSSVQGKFEPRQLELGSKIGDYWVVHGGVSEGDKVVTSANFLIDSESKIRAAINQMTSRHHH